MSLHKREFLVLLGWIGAGAVIVVVFGLVIVPWVWSLGEGPRPAPDGLGSPLGLGNVTGPTECSAVNTPVTGCLASGEFVYEIPVAWSTIEFGQLYLTTQTGRGSSYSPAAEGGFAIISSSEQVLANFTVSGPAPLAMSSPSAWTYHTTSTGISASSSLTSLCSIVVDMGSVDPGGAGYTLTANVVGETPGYSVQAGLQ